MNPFETEDGWLLPDFEVQDEIEIDQIEQNNLILIPQSTTSHSEQSHHVAVTADALADGSSNEELMLPLLDESSNDNSFHFGGSTSNLSFSSNNNNMCFDGRGMFVPAIFEGVECSEIAHTHTSSQMDGNVYSFFSSPVCQFPEPFQLSLQENVVTTETTGNIETIETNCESTLERPNDDAETIPQNQSESSSRSATAQFINSWKILAEKAARIKDRTGAFTYITTIFNDEPFEICTEQTPGRNRSISNPSVLSSGGKSLDEKSDHEAEDDHCYAAVILKQRESSPSVRDHQYNQSSPRKPIKRVSESDSCTVKLPFFKAKHHRERMLVKYMNSLFLKASKLEDVIGSNIDIKVCYESHTFTKENIQIASSLLKQRKGRYQTVQSNQGSSSISTIFHEVHEGVNRNCLRTTDNNNSDTATLVNANNKESKPQVRITMFRQPASEKAPAGVHVKFLWDKKTSRSSSNAIPTGFSNLNLNNPEEVRAEDDLSAGRTQNNSDNKSSYVFDSDFDSQPIFDADVHGGFDTNVDGEKSNSSYSSTRSTTSVSASCNGHQEEDSNHSTTLDQPTIRNHFEQEETRASSNDTETQTEPICGICWSLRPLNSLTSSSQEVFWIRCNHPLCHFLVHSDCIGFRVLSSSQLLLLPPFYCSQHRN